MSVYADHRHLLTLADWVALGEDDDFHRYELVEGVLEEMPSAVGDHQVASKRVCGQLDPQLVPDLESVPDVDVVLWTSPKATVRRPDVIVVPGALIDTHPVRYEASDVLVAIEVISPENARTDRVTKFAEYATAGIPNYWLIDLGPPVMLSAFTLAEGGYRLVAEGTGQVTLSAPTSLTIDLDALASSRRAR